MQGIKKRKKKRRELNEKSRIKAGNQCNFNETNLRGNKLKLNLKNTKLSKLCMEL